MSFEFRTDKFIYGIVIDLIDSNPYDKLIINIWVDNSYTGKHKMFHIADINNDHLGRDKSIFKILFKPLKCNESIKINVETKIICSQINASFLTK